MNPGKKGVKREFADGDAHSTKALIAKPQDPLAIRDDDDVDLLLRKLSHHGVDLVFEWIGDVEASLMGIDLAILKRSFSYSGRIDKGKHFGGVTAYELIEEDFIAIQK